MTFMQAKGCFTTLCGVIEIGDKMNFFRNPEIKRSLLLYLLLTAISAGVGFMAGAAFGIFVLFVCAAFTSAHFCITYRRYRKIADLSRKIDGVLHGGESFDFNEYSEGELSVLRTEIFKMTIRLREQTEALRKDKVYLADSIADISHQIRTPLTSINIILSFLSRPGLSENRRLEHIKELKTMVSRIDWLISALLKMAKLDAGTAKLQRGRVSVKELVKRAADTIAIPMELREQELRVSMAGDVSYFGDLSWSVEAIENILKNCMEHTPDRGVLSVAAQENALYTEIVVSDDGKGIDKNDLPHLFERFYKGKNSSDQNIGIGLALSRMIITSQNGTIKAENNSGGGARFTVRFYKSVV